MIWSVGQLVNSGDSGTQCTCSVEVEDESFAEQILRQHFDMMQTLDITNKRVIEIEVFFEAARGHFGRCDYSAG